MSPGANGASPRRMLVTGATGFIGGRLVAAAGRRGFTVRALVRGPSGPDGAELFRGDLLQPESLSGIENDVDVVVHCASALGKWGSTEPQLERVNVDGALHLLARFSGSRVRAWVHLSAGGVTGPVPGTQVDETWPCRPATAYERTKLRGELAVLERSRALGIPALVVRPTFTYGPGDPHKLALFRAVRRGRFVHIGRGDSVLHPVFIDDVLEGILAAVERGRPGETYIVGGTHPVSKRELVDSIAAALDVPPPRRRLPRALAWSAATVLELAGRTFGFEPILTRSRVMMMGDNFGYSIAKARTELGYEPAVPLAEGLRRTVRAYREAGVL